MLMVPFRVKFDLEPVSQYLDQIHDQNFRVAEVPLLGFSKIATLDQHTRSACSVHVLLIVRTVAEKYGNKPLDMNMMTTQWDEDFIGRSVEEL